MTVYGQLLLAKFAKRHAAARKPLTRFLEIALEAQWKHMPDVKESFPATDFDSGSQLYIFDIGGNKYRLSADINFETQELAIEAVMTHEEYNRK